MDDNALQLWNIFKSENQHIYLSVLNHLMLNPLVTIVMFVLIHVDLEMLWEPTSTEDIALLNKIKFS